jgi:hypothetical protein
LGTGSFTVFRGAICFVPLRRFEASSFENSSLLVSKASSTFDDDCDLDDDDEGASGNVTNVDLSKSQTKILIVDDEPFTRALVKNLFSMICKEKIECEEAGDGAEHGEISAWFQLNFEAAPIHLEH